MKINNLIIVASLALTRVALASEPVPLLGLSLGGKFPQARACSSFKIDGDKTVCWSGTPFVYKGAKSGNVHLPGADSRPRWAAYATFHAYLNKKGELDRLDVRTANSDDRGEIIKSLQARFGLPTDVSPLSESIQTAEWRKPPVFIRMLCEYTIGCKVEFSSADAYASLQSELAERAAKDKGRPVSP